MLRGKKAKYHAKSTRKTVSDNCGNKEGFLEAVLVMGFKGWVRILQGT